MVLTNFHGTDWGTHHGRGDEGAERPLRSLSGGFAGEPLLAGEWFVAARR